MGLISSFCAGAIYNPAISDADNMEIFFIRSATIILHDVSDVDSESIDIDFNTKQQLRAMNISVEGNAQCLQPTTLSLTCQY